MTSLLPRALTAVAVILATHAVAADIPGFRAVEPAPEPPLEGRFDSGLSAAEIRERMRLMAAEPNQVGSPHDKANAEYTLQQFKAWGWDAHIETFEILYP